MIRLRRQRGAALVSILVIGMTSIAFLMALTSIVTSAVRASAANKWAESVRNCAEIGADYAIDQFNSPPPCALDPVVGSGLSTKETILPASLFSSATVDGVIPTPGVPNVSVKVTVSQIAKNSDWSYLESHSSVYSPTLDFTKSESKSWSEPPSGNLTEVSGGGFRIIESTATNGLVTKTIRVILCARFDTPPGDSPNSASPRQSFFNQPLFANTKLSLSSTKGNLLVRDFDAKLAPSGNAYRLNLSTNKEAAIGTNTNIFGNVNVSSKGSASNQDVATIGTDSFIHGTLTTNGKQANSVVDTENSSPPLSSDTVKGDIEIQQGATARTGQNTNPAFVVPTEDVSALSQNLVAPAPQPSNAQNLGSLEAASGSSISGDYVVSGLDSTGIDPITLQNDGENPPTRFFIEGSQSSSAVDIDSSIFKNRGAADPRNLQIWYEGSQPVRINLDGVSDFSGLIYAPNASVSITGSGNFSGGIVGKAIAVDMSGELRIPSSITNATNSANLSKYGLSYETDGKSSAIKGWQPIVWQEL